MLRRLTLIAILTALALGLGVLTLRQSRAQSATPACRNPNLPVEQRVANPLSRMTLEEKVAQTHALCRARIASLTRRETSHPRKPERL